MLLSGQTSGFQHSSEPSIRFFLLGENHEFQVLNPMAFGGVILTGVVDRENVLDPEPPPSLRMRLNMLGVRYKIADDHLVLLPANSWVPMFKKRNV